MLLLVVQIEDAGERIDQFNLPGQQAQTGFQGAQCRAVQAVAVAGRFQAGAELLAEAGDLRLPLGAGLVLKRRESANQAITGISVLADQLKVVQALLRPADKAVGVVQKSVQRACVRSNANASLVS